jgi:hypothetical protein
LCIRAGYLALRHIADFFAVPYNANPQKGDPISVTRQAFVFVGIPTCTVPELFDQRRNDAPVIWAAAQFTGTVSDAPGAPTGNYLITTQSLVADLLVPCDSSVIVGRQ